MRARPNSVRVLVVNDPPPRLLHPDHPLGARFWGELYGWVVGLDRYCLPMHPPHCRPSSLELHGITRRALSVRPYWVGTKGVKLCHSFRQWIVPGKVEMQLSRANASTDGEGGEEWLLHILRAPLMVKQEAEYAAGGGGLAPIAQVGPDR